MAPKQPIHEHSPQDARDRSVACPALDELSVSPDGK